jgi:GxxExxY protein
MPGGARTDNRVEWPGLFAIFASCCSVLSDRIVFDEVLKFDLAIESSLFVEVKAVQEVHPVHKAQALSSMRLLDFPVGLILNFHELRLQDGLHRLILSGAAKS